MGLWAFGTSPYGLSLAPWDFWCLTPREFAALRKQYERDRDLTLQIHACLQATLHNAHFRGSQHPQAFRAEDFMPGGRKPQTVEEKKALIGAQMEMIAARFRAKRQAEA